MAGDTFASGVHRFRPPTERPLLPWEAPGLTAFFAPVGSMWFPDPLLVRAGQCPLLPFGSPAPVETGDAVAEAGQPVGGRKRTTRKTSLAAGETDQNVEEEAKLTHGRSSAMGSGSATGSNGCLSARAAPAQDRFLELNASLCRVLASWPSA